MSSISSLIDNVKISARNQFKGVIESVTPGAVINEVTVRLNKDIVIEAGVTKESATNMALAPGMEVLALIKSSHLILIKGDGFKTSARNQLWGRVSSIELGAVNAEVDIDLGEGISIVTIITNESVKSLGLEVGDKLCACAKASSIILCA